VESIPLRIASYTGVRRIRSRVHDHELRTDKIVGNGWTFECRHGCEGPWKPTRAAAMHALAEHRRLVHGEGRAA